MTTTATPIIVATWCVIKSATADTKRVFGLQVQVTANAKQGDSVMAFNRHGASQIKVIGSQVMNADGTPMLKALNTNINGVPVVLNCYAWAVAL